MVPCRLMQAMLRLPTFPILWKLTNCFVLVSWLPEPGLWAVFVVVFLCPGCGLVTSSRYAGRLAWLPCYGVCLFYHGYVRADALFLCI